MPSVAATRLIKFRTHPTGDAQRPVGQSRIPEEPPATAHETLARLQAFLNARRPAAVGRERGTPYPSRRGLASYPTSLVTASAMMASISSRNADETS